MGYTCEFCGEQRSIIYCRSDAACLCLSCDLNVHSANALSQRHSRTLVCERCNSQPAIFRCVEEKVSLCQNCDWMAHASSSSTTGSTHKRQTLNCYTGCPSAVELSTIWSFLLDDPSVGDLTCEQGMGSMSITDCQLGDSERSQAKEKSQDMNDLHNLVKPSLLMGSSMPNLERNELHNVELPVGSTNLTWSKVNNSGRKGSNLFDNDPFYEDFNVDEVDVSIENYEELFGVSLDNPNEGIDGLFGTKEMSVPESSCQGVNAIEGLAVGRVNVVKPSCSNAAWAESTMSCKTEPPTLCFARQHSSLSFSNLTGESSAGYYQNCGASMLLMGEPPLCPPCPESSMPSTSRNHAVLRYKEKKKIRQFDKRVRYVSRKARADVRRRVKGRFVKAGDAYDYDPLSQTRSY